MQEQQCQALYEIFTIRMAKLHAEDEKNLPLEAHLPLPKMVPLQFENVCSYVLHENGF